MRREFEEFYRLYPQERSKAGVDRWKAKAAQQLLKMRMSYVKAGSEQWHRIQQILSKRSSDSVSAELRGIFYENSLKCCGDGIYVLPGVIMCYPYRLSVGKNVFINRGTYITARAKISIGNNVMIGPYVVINSGMHRYRDKYMLIRDQGHRLEPIVIGDDVWLGAHAVIMPGVRIGEGAVIGAGAVVTHSIPPFAVAAGVPAKVISYRTESGRENPEKN